MFGGYNILSPSISSAYNRYLNFALRNNSLEPYLARPEGSPMFKNFVFNLTLASSIIAGASSASFAQDQPAAGMGIQPAAIADTGDEASMIEKVSLVFGYNAIGKMSFEMKRQGLELDMDKVLEGAKLAADGSDLGMSQEEVKALVGSLQTVMREKQTKMMAEAADKNKAAGEAYLAKNSTKAGVMKLDNGVQYEIMKEGDGPKPAATDKVQLHYHGTTVDGKVFDSSVDKGEPITHSASGFVKGFNAAVQAMPVGSKWKVTIPSDLAYGMSGPLGPNQTLVFEIELLDIVKE